MTPIKKNELSEAARNNLIKLMAKKLPLYEHKLKDSNKGA
jgi:hypothetical protein